MKVLLDSNFLMLAGRKGIDIFEELRKFGNYELFTLDVVKKELEKLRDRNGTESRLAKMALEAIKNRGIDIIKTGKDTKDTDREIERVAKNMGFVVCTEDRALRSRLIKGGVKVIALRQGKYLVRLGYMERD